MLIRAEVSQYSSLLNKATSEEEEKRASRGDAEGLLGTRDGEDRQEAKDVSGSGRGESTQRKQEKEKEVGALGGQRSTGSQCVLVRQADPGVCCQLSRGFEILIGR